jgi:DNA-binding NarL/FixJ family response regulator
MMRRRAAGVSGTLPAVNEPASPPPVAPLRVAIVEDDARYRASLETLLRHAPGVELAASFARAEGLLAEAAAGAPAWRLVLMDVDLPGTGGIEATRELKRLRPGVLVVTLTVFEEPRVILEAICAGADGYVLKRTPPAQLLEMLQVVALGGAPLTPGVARTVLELVRAPQGALPNDLGLSTRERDVLRGLVQGLAYKQVADRLGISLDTVRTHVRGMYRKLQVHSVAEAVSRALRERLI